MSKTFLALCLMIGSLLLPSAGQAAGNEGDPCTAAELGRTEMSSDQVNILACLQTKPTKSGVTTTYVWKNFMPDNKIVNADTKEESCENGSLAIQKAGGFVCKYDGVCNDGDRVVYKDGRFVCAAGPDGGTLGSNTIGNYEYAEMPVIDVPGEEVDAHGEYTVMHPAGTVMATASFTGTQLYNATISDKGVPLFSVQHVAKMTGNARVNAVIPIRILQQSLVREQQDLIKAHSHANAMFVGKNQWETTFRADVYVKDLADTSGSDGWLMTGDIFNPDSGIDGSTGDVGQLFTTFPIVTGHTYKIDLYLVSTGGQNVTYRAWAGTMWPFYDTRATGYVEVEEISGPVSFFWDIMP